MESALFPHNLRGRNGKPLFREPSHFDFRPADGSPASALGVILPGITDGFNGTAMDLGVYESHGWS